jgi:homoserine kinase type II
MAYTEVPFEDASDIVRAAGLSELVHLEKLSGGWANSNYKLSLTDNSKIVLKIWNEQSIDEVSYLLSITTYLCDNDVPTPAPIKFSNGDLIMEKNGLAWTLLPFIEGAWLVPNTTSLYSLGRKQARLHLVKPPANLKEEFSMGYSLFEKLFSIADEKDEWSDFLYMLKSETLTLNQNINELPRGIIHGDLFPDNILATNDNVNTILDFEEVCHDVLAFDLVMTFVGCGWHNGEPVFDRWKALLEGYQSIRILNQDEINSLSDLHRLATLSIAAWRYWQFVFNLPNTDHTDRYLEMTERLNKPLPF